MNHARLTAAAITALLLAGCSGTRVDLGDRVATPAAAAAPGGKTRELDARACGFQLLLLIPINVNDRLERAYQILRGQAGAETITDVRMQETWTYAFVGTVYCTNLKATAIAG